MTLLLCDLMVKKMGRQFFCSVCVCLFGLKINNLKKNCVSDKNGDGYFDNEDIGQLKRVRCCFAILLGNKMSLLKYSVLFHFQNGHFMTSPANHL